MDKKEFLKLSYELDKSGKFLEADSLTNAFIKVAKDYVPYVPKSSGYIDIDKQIYDRGLYRGISPLRGQLSGLQLWMGGGFRREAYIQGALQEARSFSQLKNHWPSERNITEEEKNQIEKDYDSGKTYPKKREFYDHMNKAIEALKQIAKNQGVGINPDAWDWGIESFFKNTRHTTRDIFLEFSRWVEGQFRIFSKEGAYYPYLVQLRYAETTLASEVDPGILTPVQQKKKGARVGGPLTVEPTAVKPGAGPSESTSTAPGAAQAPPPAKKPNTPTMSRQKIENPAKTMDSSKVF